MKKQVPLTPVLAVGLVIVALVAYMVLIKPKRAESARLDAEIAEIESKIAAASAAVRAEPQLKIDIADLFRLAKAMPDQEDMPGIILELNSVASSAGVRFLSIQPQPAVASGSYRALPITLTFEGNYYDLTDFLYRLRNLVTVKDGTLDATGRLYTLDAIDLHESPKGFPQIEAALTVSAYVFGTSPEAAPAASSPPAETETATTGTETAETGTTPTTPAAPAPGDEETQALGGTP